MLTVLRGVVDVKDTMRAVAAQAEADLGEAGGGFHRIAHEFRMSNSQHKH